MARFRMKLPRDLNGGDLAQSIVLNCWTAGIQPSTCVFFNALEVTSEVRSPKALAINCFCSSLWLLADPVAGVEEAGRCTPWNGYRPSMRSPKRTRR